MKHWKVEVSVRACDQFTCLLHHTYFTRFLWETLDRKESQILFIDIMYSNLHLTP